MTHFFSKIVFHHVCEKRAGKYCVSIFVFVDFSSDCVTAIWHLTPHLQLGKTKLFLKHPETIFALEELKNGVLHSLAARIQRAWRRYISNKKYALTHWMKCCLMSAH
jgi:myosin heavy subunit